MKTLGHRGQRHELHVLCEAPGCWSLDVVTDGLDSQHIGHLSRMEDGVFELEAAQLLTSGRAEDVLNDWSELLLTLI